MKNRTLKRPMFRKGGPAMEGIMTGIQDRTNYNEGGRATELAEEYAKLLRRMAPSPTDRSLPQFLIQGGLNLVSGKGATGNTLRDIASAYQQPTAGLFKGIQARDAYDSQIGMAAAKAGISGAQSEANKSESVIAAEKKARYLLPNNATPEQIRAKTAELIMREETGSTYSTKAILERSIAEYRKVYGDGSRAFNHATFDVKIAKLLRAAGKNPKSNIKIKDGKYKTKNKSPGVYIDTENGKVIEILGPGQVKELPEYTKLLR